MHFCHLSCKDVNNYKWIAAYNYKPPFTAFVATLPRNLRTVAPKTYSSSEEKFTRDDIKGDKLVVEVPECDVLRGHLTPEGTCERRLIVMDHPPLSYPRDGKF
ncbi:hypothetical protein AVEN_36966-1 [Araneus ventricosus]|uniref:Uncharacterized protein n=1 Tax=Araneus ventricosus TaxID=182803 RepID=A0A4Y2M7I8_ARAVE|nr:hypothetical protein AVEN_240318-1 [Araneus ventricosus]GBN21617.1 hypothetical protein AVEN_36966-1 [Araneus ventricosus]